ncbi:unnamed protein product [Orchesella dallaii]|uniref:Uncharacterized protein n=1 Tax=Orchesella dallaii TaxID=48710 RepID=A0ABP1QAT3_9HEXA
MDKLKRYLQLSRIPFLRGHIKSNLITQVYGSRLESEMGNNSDFLSELLRINGLLQASLTELRYRCEVYRLSLRSICKVLGKVQKEHELRLCGLTTSRYSYQTYLQNLSQKQALDRISNVVKKASTFINGYSLVDKDQFQPPPPKPKPVNQEKRAAAQTTGSCTSSSFLALTHSDSDANSLTGSINTNGTYANSEKIKSIADAAFCKLNKTEVLTTRHLSEKHDRKKTSSKRSRSKERRKYCKTQGKNRNEHHRKVKTLTKGENLAERDVALPEKQTMSLSVSRQRCQLHNPRHQQHDTRSKLSERRNYSSIRSQSQKHHSSTEGKSCMVYPNDSLRAEETTRHGRPSFERKERICYNEIHDEKKGVCAAHLKEIHESCERKIRYNVRENFTPRSHTSTQGQGIATRYLFSTHKSHNNLKLSFVAEKVRRIQLCKISESRHASRQTMTGVVK